MREAVVHELDCGCGRHLEGKDEQCLVIKVFLHLEAAHPEIEEPTIELTEGWCEALLELAGRQVVGQSPLCCLQIPRQLLPLAATVNA